MTIIVSALIDSCIQSEFIQMRGKGKTWSKEGDRGTDYRVVSRKRQRIIPELHSDTTMGGCRDDM